MNLRGKRVLVVEDEALVCMMLERALGALGCEVVATAGGLEDALQKAATLAVDVAILDINLAGKASYPIARLLRGQRIPFLFATGYGETDVAPDLKGVLTLSKPFRLRRLEDALRLAMASANPA